VGHFWPVTIIAILLTGISVLVEVGVEVGVEAGVEAGVEEGVEIEQ
jgi:hypothetical protein